EASRSWLFGALPRALTPGHRRFLLSLTRGDPDWSLLPYAHLKDMPAVKWKLLNLQRFIKAKPEQAIAHHDDLWARFAGLGGE
ncbi:MAG: nucleotidyl transferase AbiEii/AbiGii toxin family protein, partial [Burkholderiaceae bacterium]